MTPGPRLALAAILLLVPSAGAQVADAVCLLCHGDVQPDSGDDAPRAHRDLSCVECHVALWDSDVEEEFEHELDLAPVSCTPCHGDQADLLASGVHAPRGEGDRRPYPTCTSCHGTEHFQVLFEARPPAERARAVDASCSACHGKDLDAFHASAHGRLLAEGDPRAPGCTACHAPHAVHKPSDPRSAVHPDNVSSRCEMCHTDARASLHRTPGQPPPSISCTFCHLGHRTDLEALRDRISTEAGVNKCAVCHAGQHTDRMMAHGLERMRAALSGDQHCTTCHVYHWKVDGARATPVRVQEDCAQCHGEQHEAWARSVHGRSHAAGNPDPPTCATCHGTTRVQRAGVQFRGTAIVDQCASCHANEEMMLSYDVNPHVVEGFEETYHGKLFDLENTQKQFAVCTSCHGHHEILEAEDPDSSVNRAQLLETCRQCHPGANEKFITYLAHPILPTAAERARARELVQARAARPPREGVDPDPEGSVAKGSPYATAFRLANWLMKALFTGVMTFFVLHTFLWFQRGVRHGPKRKYYRRFSNYDRMLHVMVNVSFLTLAFTGLPQSFSDTTMGRWMLEHVISIETAQELHYWAAALTGLYFLLHLLQVASNLRKKGWRAMFTGSDTLVPRRKDWDDFVQHVRWFLGKGDRPRFDRWTYWEKFDYLAVFWGVFVIGLSGLIRWREELFGNLLGGGVVSVATAVHEEEALLATAFIFIVHFFNTHLRREKFPMDTSIYTGLVSEHELSEERPLQYERLVREGRLAELEEEARPAWAIALATFWGTTALLIGLFLLVLIVAGLLTTGI